MGFPPDIPPQIPLKGGLSVSFTSEQVQRAWTNMPAAVTDFQLKTGCRFRGNLTPFTRARIVVCVQGTAGFAGSILKAQYSTDNSVWNDLGASVSVDVLGFRDSGWVDIPAGAKADNIYVRVVGSGGDGLVDPTFTDVQVNFDI